MKFSWTPLNSQSQTSADIVDIFRTVGMDEEVESSDRAMNGWCSQRSGAPLAEKEVVSPTSETILTRTELVNGFEKKLD